ncbi:ABC transporter substrate-binding protein [Vibrio sp. PP-XX7]
MLHLLRRSLLNTIGLPLLLTGSLVQAAVLTIGRDGDSTTFDPINSTQNYDNWVFSNVFDPLIRIDKTGTKLIPGLAKSWQISKDGLVYTLQLRHARFSDGSDVTAKDAAFSLRRIRDDSKSLWQDSYKIMQSITAKDAYTLVIKLKSPSVPFYPSLPYLMLPSFLKLILNKSAKKRSPGNLSGPVHLPSNNGIVVKVFS